MKTKKTIVEIICFLLMLHFFYEGIYKITYLSHYSFYITHAPLLSPVGKVLTYIVPIGEIILSVMIMLPRFRKAASYMVIVVQFAFVVWVMSVYLFTHYLFWPYHALWNEPTWMQKMIFALALSWLAFTVIILSGNITLIRNKKLNTLRNTPANVN